MGAMPLSLVAPCWPGIIGQDTLPLSLDAYLLANNGSRWSFRTAAAAGGQLMQENTGPTLADDAGEAIGLVLDQGLWGGKTLAQVIAAATELVSNGAFTIDLTSWSNGRPLRGDVVQSSGTVVVTNDSTNGEAGGFASVVQGISTVVGRIYRLSADMVSGAWILRAASSSDGISSIAAVTGSGAAAGTSFYFVATGTTTYVTLMVNSSTNAAAASMDNVSCKLIPGIPAIQPTGGFKSQWQAGGWARYDGSDDRHTQSRLMGSTGLVLIRSKFIAKSASTRIMFGAVGSGGTDRIFCGNDTNGYAVARVGNGSTISGSVDRTDVDGTVGVVWDGTQAGLVEDGNVTYQSQTGAPTTTVAPIIGGYNNNGTPGSFSNFDAKEVIYLPVAPNAATIKKLHNVLMAV